MTNAEIARVFQSIADILAIQGANPFRIRAYERAALTLGSIPEDCDDIYRSRGIDALQEIGGIGEELAAKIVELLDTGKLRFYEDLKRKVPSGLLEIMEVEGMGPKRTKFVWQEFDVRNIRDLERLCRFGKLTKVRGWGVRSAQNILIAIAAQKRFGERMSLGTALPIAESIVRTLERSAFCDRVAIAGSLRRRRETIGDIDLLVTSDHPARVMDLFCSLPIVERVHARGPTKANVRLKSGIEADLRVLDPEVFGAALHYFTGSKAHNIRVRTIGVQRGLTISEYGVFRGTKERKGRRIACHTEEEVFRVVGLPYIPPELREDTGEVEAALAGKLPTLVEVSDIRGDLHLHSDVSDGTASMIAMITAAKQAGRAYIAITDHASVMGMVRGIAVRRTPGKVMVADYVKRVRAAAKKVRGIHVLAGAEVDILADGSLSLPDDALRELDWVVGSIHQSFKQTELQATQRLLRAMENPYLRCVGHPTTRIIGQRGGMVFDWDALFTRARQLRIAFELNAAWQRLDLDDVRCRQAKAAGVKICVNSDAHAPLEFDLRYGISQARRGWVAKGDVVNALPWAKFSKVWLRRA